MNGDVTIPLNMYTAKPIALTEEERKERAPCPCGGIIRKTKAWTAQIDGREYKLFRLSCNRCGGRLGNNVVPRVKRGRGGRRKRVQRKGVRR